MIFSWWKCWPEKLVKLFLLTNAVWGLDTDMAFLITLGVLQHTLAGMEWLYLTENNVSVKNEWIYLR